MGANPIHALMQKQKISHVEMQKSRTSFADKTSKGSSLLIALGLISIIVIVAAGVTTLVASSIRQSANVNSANQAYYAAEGALEQGLLVNVEQGSPGFSTTSTNVNYPSCANAGPNVICALKANYTVQGQVQAGVTYNDSYPGMYGIPSPGTGDAGKNCDSLTAVTNTGFWYDPNTDTWVTVDPGANSAYTISGHAEDHPCNWNRMYVNQSVTIPLYYLDPANNNHVTSLFNSNSHFKLRIRTGCTGGKIECGTRPTLDDTQGDPNYSFDDPIVTWQITAEDQAQNPAYSLLPYIKFNNPNHLDPNSTIIIESKMNNASNNELLDEVKVGVDPNNCRGSILKFLTSQNTPICLINPNWSTQQLTKPLLKFTVIHSLDDKNNSGGKVPYLEYQLLSNVSVPPTDTVQTITSEGFSSTFKQVLQVKIPQDSGILEYVIQQ